MTIDEIIALAKAGYKKKDIDAIVASNEKKEEKTASDSFLSQPSEETTTDLKVGETVVADSETNESEAEEANDITKEAIDIANAEIERLKKELAIAQEKNTRTEVTNTVSTDEETVNDMVRSFM